MEKPRTPGMVLLSREKDGETELVERWPVDAREMLATGDWVLIDGIVGAQAPLPHVAAAQKALDDHPFNVMERSKKQPKVTPAPAIPEEETEVAVDTTSAETEVTLTDSLPEWPLKWSPDGYLKKYPEGKHAELARRHIEAASAAESAVNDADD